MAEPRPAVLARRIKGEIILPSSLRYDEARKVFNGMIDKRPAVIARPRDEGEVLACLEYAVGAGLEVAIRGGGHNVAGLASVDGGFVIDFKAMRGIEVDPYRRVARVGPGATWGEFDALTERHGLATTGGIVSDTGISGLTLGGGLGWLMGEYGLACDNMISARVMLADGSMTVASNEDDTDLLWALRGGGGNFGVVTLFEFALHPVREVFAGSVVYDVSQMRLAVERFRELGDAAPDELTMSLVGMTDAAGQKVVSVDACFVGAEKVGRSVTRGLVVDSGAPLSDSRRVRRYADWQKQFDDPYRKGRRSYWKSVYIEDLSDAFADFLADALHSAPSAHTMLTFDHVHGAASRIGQDFAAFSVRDGRYLFLVNTNWDDPAADALNMKWAESVFESAIQFGSRLCYVNYLGNEGASRICSAYSAESLVKLGRMKARYDPGNVFHVNQNIGIQQKL